MAQPAEHMRVLVVDDEAPARQRIVDLLRKDPQVGTILEAANGNAAVEIIASERLDLVFLDVKMPFLLRLSRGSAIARRSRTPFSHFKPVTK